MKIHRRATAALVGVVAALAVSGSAVAFDCIRVSSSLEGLQQSTKSGNWLLFDLSTAQGVQNTFTNFGSAVDESQAQCFAAAYAESGAPAYFALGTGVAGGKNETNKGGSGVLAWHNPNDAVLSDGRGIDHLEDTAIFPAFLNAAQACGIPVS
jgi:hypothetical protein